MKIFRDSNGAVINIGEWDYQEGVHVESNGEETPVVKNPLPQGVVEYDEEVVTGWDGGLYVVGDSRIDRL